MIFNASGRVYGRDCLTKAVLYGSGGSLNSCSSGTDFSCVINSAISNLPPNLGGTILLGSGTYTVTNSIVIPNNVALIGSGTNQTILEASSSLNSSVIENSAGSSANTGALLEFFTIDGEYDSNPIAGIVWYSDSAPTSSSCIGCRIDSLDIEFVNVFYMKGDGVDFLQGIQGHGWVYARQLDVRNNQGIGIKLVSPDSTLDDVYGGSNSTTAPVLYISGGSDTIIGSYFGGSSFRGGGQVELFGAIGTTFLGTIIDFSSSYGLYVYGTPGSVVNRNITFSSGEISDCCISATNKYAFVYLHDDVQGIVFSGTKFYQSVHTTLNLAKALIFTSSTDSTTYPALFYNCLIQNTSLVDGPVTVDTSAGGNFYPGTAIFRSNPGYNNPVGKISDPFLTGDAQDPYTVGLGGNGTTIEPGTTYLVSGVDLSNFVCTGGIAAVAEEDPSGNIIQNLSSPLTYYSIPAGDKLVSSNFIPGNAPSCTVFGN